MDSKFESAKYIDVRVKSEHTIDVKKPGFLVYNCLKSHSPDIPSWTKSGKREQ